MLGPIWNVSTMNDRDDDGITISFDDESKAGAYLAWAEDQGFWWVQIWRA